MDDFQIYSTLQDLQLHHFGVRPETLGSEIYQAFEQNPVLPGVILLTQDGSLQGIVSRRHFLEIMSRQYGRELFLRRSITVLYRFMAHDFLKLSGAAKITEAAQQAISRSSELLYEPIVVECQTPQDQPFYLLDVHDLLQAQSIVHQLTADLLIEKTQAERLHTEKMASLGKMMAGVAHEIRNPVNFIWGNLNYLEEYTEDLTDLVRAYEGEIIHPSKSLIQLKQRIDPNFVLDDLPQMLQSMKTGADRLRHLVTSLRTFSRMDETQRDLIDIHQSLDSTLQILNNRIKEGVTIDKQYADDLPEISCFCGQIGQVFMNIISNALDALLTHQAALAELEKTKTNFGLTPQASDIPLWEPRITLMTSPRDRLPVDVPHPSTTLDASTASWLSIRIRDNGPGIPQEIQEQVFQDFFTTKPSGDGTGLGLPITRQIVTEKHGGYLILRSPIPEVAESQPTSGTEFEILLPMRVSPTINPRAQFSAPATRPALFSP
ncbi:MAG: ATP-binding protein [Leptolyngbya sp. SIOISBB]|nr:ATP-binding protein [Leptolyngbya sp. SIOISBB]